MCYGSDCERRCSYISAPILKSPIHHHHVPEAHVKVTSSVCSGSLYDFGVTVLFFICLGLDLVVYTGLVGVSGAADMCLWFPSVQLSNACSSTDGTVFAVSGRAASRAPNLILDFKFGNLCGCISQSGFKHIRNNKPMRRRSPLYAVQGRPEPGLSHLGVISVECLDPSPSRPRRSLRHPV